MVKIIKVFLVVCLVTMTVILSVAAYDSNNHKLGLEPMPLIDSNHFSQQSAIDQRPITLGSNDEHLSAFGFEEVAREGNRVLYITKDVFNIAVHDLDNDYVWYGFYPGYEADQYTNRLNQLIRSGITIDFYDAQTLNEATMSIGHEDAGTTMTFTNISDGIQVHIDMVRMGISFSIELWLDEGSLHVKIPYESIVEVPFQTPAMRFPREYRVRAIYVFPYFGSENHQINGYAMIPDGSGALIAYTDLPHQTAYIRRLFGRDLGIQSSVTTMPHLKPEEPLTLPVFGINHGYQQAAFLAEIISGYGASELHSYPFGYNTVRINTTFFAYRTRDKALIQMAGTASGIPIINKDPYPTDFHLRYTFLQGEEADYSGMARAYKDHLNLTPLEPTDQIGLHLDVLGLEYKGGLLGKSYVPLTEYEALAEILMDLRQNKIGSMSIVYRGYNRRGFYDNTPIRPVTARQLGGNRGFSSMMDTVTTLGNIDISLYDDPLVVSSQTLFNSVIKRTTLDLLRARIDSSLNAQGYYLSVADMANRISRHDQRYEKLGITSLTLETVGQQSFSYRHQQETYYREAMIHQVTESLASLQHTYSLGLYRPAAYTYPYIDRYYHMFHEANRYHYITHSIPFISLVLSGNVELYGPSMNYVNNPQQMTLRMVEYGLWPSFMITDAESYLLRYTNSEHRFTTEFALWRDTIIEVYTSVNETLGPVAGVSMTNHTYIAQGIARVTYENGHIIYINHTDSDVMVEGVLVQAKSAQAGGDGS